MKKLTIKPHWKILKRSINYGFFLCLFITAFITLLCYYKYKEESDTYINGIVVETKVISKNGISRGRYSLGIQFNNKEYVVNVNSKIYDGIKSGDRIKLKYSPKYSHFQEIKYNNYNENLYFSFFFSILIILVLVKIPLTKCKLPRK